MTASLDQVALGRKVRIERLDGDDALTQRLMEMGLMEGEELEVIGLAPFGDPMELRLRDYRLSLRRAEAKRVQVAILS
jgi:ferrous iron transport protein A